MYDSFSKLPRYELRRDLSADVMKRIRREEAEGALRRLVLTILPLSAAAFGLVGYRWYTFVRFRDYSSVASNIVGHLDRLSKIFTLGYWFEAFTVVRQSLPMVETTLLMVNVAIVAIFAWKFLSLKFLERRSEPFS